MKIVERIRRGKRNKKKIFSILRHLLSDHHGNANKRNRSNQTALHCLLQSGNEVRRNECLTLLLKWKEKQTNETIDIDAKDSVIEFNQEFQILFCLFFRMIILHCIVQQKMDSSPVLK